MEISTETIQEQIPYYLTQEQKSNLVKALKDFPKVNYYIDGFASEILQGDGWDSFDIINFDDGARKKIKGIVLSNSCDITPLNKRDFPPRLTFAPIIKLRKFVEQLEKSGIHLDKINSRLLDIREQRVTTMFYLPKGGSLDEEYIAILDDLHTIPFNIFETHHGKLKQFTLSQVGFYLFLLKLSVHFCRFHENKSRN